MMDVNIIKLYLAIFCNTFFTHILYIYIFLYTFFISIFTSVSAPYHGFNSIIIENRLISVMTGNFGRKRRFMSIAVVGNGKGLIGLAKCRALDSKAAINKARKKAMKRLVSYDFLEENTGKISTLLLNFLI